MWLIVNDLFLFTFKINADWPPVNDIPISRVADSKMHGFDWLNSHITLWHLKAMPHYSDSPWQLS